MQKIVSFIPHLFTLGNLFCGCLAIIFAFDWRLDWAAYMVFLAAFLDFFDGFLARILKVEGELGKQLDSLADMVSFGVVPGIVMFQWLRHIGEMEYISGNGRWGIDSIINSHSFIPWYSYAALIIPVFSCYRLAKFNIDTRQSNGFIGLPTPANAIFFCSTTLIVTFFGSLLEVDWLPSSTMEKNLLVGDYLFVSKNIDTGEIINPINDAGFFHTFPYWFADLLNNSTLLIILTVIFSFLLVSPLPLFALKFKNFGWTDNKIRYIFLALCAVLLILFQFIAIPFIVILYIVLSIINNIFKLTV